MTFEETYAAINAIGWFVTGMAGWWLLRTTARAVGDWLIRWRIAGHHCNHCQEENR